MEKQPLSVSFKDLLKMDIEQNTKSWEPVVRNNWIIKFSVYKENVFIIFTSVITAQTIIRYFDDENKACQFINFILHQNPAVEHSNL